MTVGWFRLIPELLGSMSFLLHTSLGTQAVGERHEHFWPLTEATANPHGLPSWLEAEPGLPLTTASKQGGNGGSLV